MKINRKYSCSADDSCWDEDIFNCPVWAKAGACKDSNWVIKTCPNLCCSDTGKPWGQLKICNQSVNNSRSDCGYIGSTLGCTNVTTDGGIAKYCRQSCGFCKRPVKYKLKPMIVTQCFKTCHPMCNTNNGCNLSLPANNPDFDIMKPQSKCMGNVYSSTAQWCANSTYAQTMFATTCNTRQTCPSRCVDKDTKNCARLKATLGCFSPYPL